MRTFIDPIHKLQLTAATWLTFPWTTKIKYFGQLMNALNDKWNAYDAVSFAICKARALQGTLTFVFLSSDAVHATDRPLKLKIWLWCLCDTYVEMYSQILKYSSFWWRILVSSSAASGSSSIPSNENIFRTTIRLTFHEMQSIEINDKSTLT